MSDQPCDAIIASILPAAAVGVEAFDAVADAALFPEEAALVDRAVEKRRREFAAGRHLARRALERIGVPALPILSGPTREPMWPEGVVGSITHCAGYCAATVAPSDAIATIGIDAEVNEALPEGVLHMVAGARERDWMAARRGRICWDRVLFSAKESVFKAWFPIARRWLDFQAVEIVLHPETAAFEAIFLTERPVIGGRVVTSFEGRYLVHGQHVLTSVALLRAGHLT